MVPIFAGFIATCGCGESGTCRAFKPKAPGSSPTDVTNYASGTISAKKRRLCADSTYLRRFYTMTCGRGVSVRYRAFKLKVPGSSPTDVTYDRSPSPQDVHEDASAAENSRYSVDSVSKRVEAKKCKMSF